MAPHPKHTAQGDARFFRVLETGRAVRDACAAAGYSRAAVYRRRKADAAFARRWKLAEAMALGLLEDEADRRARDGVERPVEPQKGRPTRRYSDTLLLARLKALRPDLYRDPPAPPQPAPGAAQEPPRTQITLIDFLKPGAPRYETTGTHLTPVSHRARKPAAVGPEPGFANATKCHT